VSVSIKQLVTFRVNINIPPNSNLPANFTFTCASPGFQYGHIKAIRVISMGRNIDGLMREYNASFLSPTFYSTNSSATFYTDSANFDLGIITNTGNYYYYFSFHFH
jgi:hypothetical protein